VIARAIVRDFRQELFAVALLIAFLTAFFNSHGVFSILGGLQ